MFRKVFQNRIFEEYSSSLAATTTTEATTTTATELLSTTTEVDNTTSLQEIVTEWFNATLSWFGTSETTFADTTTSMPPVGTWHFSEPESAIEQQLSELVTGSPTTSTVTTTTATAATTNESLPFLTVQQFCEAIMTDPLKPDPSWFNPNIPPPEPLVEDGVTVPEILMMATAVLVVLHQVDQIVRDLYSTACYYSDQRLVSYGYRPDDRSTRIWKWVAHILQTTWIPLRFNHDELRQAAVRRACSEEDIELTHRVVKWYREHGQFPCDLVRGTISRG